MPDLHDAAASRDWSLEELRQATRLVFNPDGRSDIDTKALASATGVSVRQVQRWFGGESRPSTANRQMLRSALLAPVDVRERQDDVARNARTAADLVEEYRRTARITPRVEPWLRDLWLEPHLLLILRNPDIGYARAGTSREDSSAGMNLHLKAVPRPATTFGRMWEVVDAYRTRHRFDAVLLRHALLQQLGSWRVCVHREHMPKGHSDGWLASAPLPDLNAIARGARIEGQRLPVRLDDPSPR